VRQDSYEKWEYGTGGEGINPEYLFRIALEYEDEQIIED
jgi:hypothetical protein